MTAPQPYPILEIDADFGDGQVTGIFHVVNATVEETTRTGYLVDSGLSTTLALFNSLTEDGASNRKGVKFGAGGGQHVFEIDLSTWTGSTNQWGSTSDDTVVSESSATGADRITQMNIFQNYLRVASTDSFTPARLQYGQYDPDGVLEDHLKVAIESPTFVVDRETSSVVEGSITLVEVADLTQTQDAQQRSSR